MLATIFSFVGDASLIDIASGRQTYRLACRYPTIDKVIWSPDGKRLATASGPTVQTWDVVSGKMSHSYPGVFTAWAWSPDNRTLALSQGNKVTFRDVTRGGGPPDFQGLKGAVSLLAWSPDGKDLACWCDDKTIQLVDLASANVRQSISNPEHLRPLALAWSPDGKALACLGDAAQDWSKLSVRLYDAATAGHRHTLAARARFLAWSPDSKVLATSDNWKDKPVQLWDAVSGKKLTDLALPSGPVAWLPGSNTLVINSHDSRLRVVDSRKPKEPPRVFDGPSEGVFSADGRMLAAVLGGTLQLWETEGGRPRGTLVLLDNNQWLAVSAGGHYRSFPVNLRDLVYVVQTRAGQDTLGAEEFAQKYGWKNDPEKVRLTGD
jgi:WD40 repeat protein